MFDATHCMQTNRQHIAAQNPPPRPQSRHHVHPALQHHPPASRTDSLPFSLKVITRSVATIDGDNDNEQTSERTNERTNEQTNERTNKRTNERTNERTTRHGGSIERTQPTANSQHNGHDHAQCRFEAGSGSLDSTAARLLLEVVT